MYHGQNVPWENTIVVPPAVRSLLITTINTERKHPLAARMEERLLDNTYDVLYNL